MMFWRFRPEVDGTPKRGETCLTFRRKGAERQMSALFIVLLVLVVLMFLGAGIYTRR